jgi:hypothetical protein
MVCKIVCKMVSKNHMVPNYGLQNRLQNGSNRSMGTRIGNDSLKPFYLINLDLTPLVMIIST